jgi:hypothetical protein
MGVKARFLDQMRFYEKQPVYTRFWSAAGSLQLFLCRPARSIYVFVDGFVTGPESQKTFL